MELLKSSPVYSNEAEGRRGTIPSPGSVIRITFMQMLTRIGALGVCGVPRAFK